MSVEVAGLPLSPGTPLGEALHALDAFTGEERETFFSSIDLLPNIAPCFESPSGPTPHEADHYEIEEEDWTWLATQVGTRTQQELAQFAKNEYERMALEDPDLVRAPQLPEQWSRAPRLPYPRIDCFAPRPFGERRVPMEPRRPPRSPARSGTRGTHVRPLGGHLHAAPLISRALPQALLTAAGLGAARTVRQAELARLGASEIGGDSLEDQLAACQELTNFAERFDTRQIEVRRRARGCARVSFLALHASLLTRAAPLACAARWRVQQQ